MSTRDEIVKISEKMLAVDNELDNLGKEKEMLRNRLFELLDDNYHFGAVTFDLPETGMRIGRSETTTRKAGWNTTALKMQLGVDYEAIVDYIDVLNEDKLNAALQTGKIKEEDIRDCMTPVEKGMRLFHRPLKGSTA